LEPVISAFERIGDPLPDADTTGVAQLFGLTGSRKDRLVKE
jgi:hypothetical protein